VQELPNGELYYIDENGKMVMLGKGMEMKENGGWMNIKEAPKKHYGQCKTFDQIYKKFPSSDQDLMQKIDLMDEDTKQLLLVNY
jgi:hypothetical protein